MSFDAGPRGAALTDWLNDYAAAYHAEGLCKVWILCPIDNPSDVLGYFTLLSEKKSILHLYFV